MAMMKRLLLLATALALMVFGCSNDTKLPAKYHDDVLDQPTAVEALLDGSDFSVTWQMTSTANVDGYVVSLTDTSGAQDTRFVDDSTATTYTEAGLQLQSATFYIIRLWAVDDVGFFGPTSEPDTLVVP
jgi:hypothetical protein